MKKVLIFVLVLGLTFVTGSMTLGKGLFGVTDLMDTPTTATLGPGAFGLGLNVAEADQFFGNLDLGLANDLEMGIAFYGYKDFYGSRDTDVTVRGKFRLLHESSSQPALAIGIEDIGNDDFSPYIVLSKTFQESGVRGYIGAGGGAFDGLFGGISKNFKVTGGAVKQVQLLLEADSNNLNVGTRLMLDNQTSINFGLMDMENWMIGATFHLK